MYAYQSEYIMTQCLMTPYVVTCYILKDHILTRVYMAISNFHSMYPLVDIWDQRVKNRIKWKILILKYK